MPGRRSSGTVRGSPDSTARGRDNIAYGRPEPTQVEGEAAAWAARAHEIIVQ